MQSRLPIVMMSVAGTAALFGIGFLLGLGVMSTPKPAEKHKEIALTSTPTKVARAETTGSGTRDDRALTPLTPVAPGGAAAQAAQPTQPAQAPSEQASAKTTQEPAAPQSTPAPAPQQAAAAAPQSKDEAKPQAAPVQTAKAEPAPAAPAPNATPVALESRNACDVSACSRAYRSFRESDCTYQPYSGPRQVCVGPPGAKEASRGRDARQASRGDDEEPTARVRVHRAGRADELDSVVHEVERMTDGRRRAYDERPVARRYHRDYTADGEDDGVVPANADDGWDDDQ